MWLCDSEREVELIAPKSAVTSVGIEPTTSGLPPVRPRTCVSVSGTTFFRFRNEQQFAQAADIFLNQYINHGASRPFAGACQNPGVRKKGARVCHGFSLSGVHF